MIRSGAVEGSGWGWSGGESVRVVESGRVGSR